MDIITWEGHKMVAFSYIEELNVAKTVMDYMANNLVRGDFQALLERIYHSKCARGSWVNADDFMAMLDFADRYGFSIPDVIYNHDNIKDSLDDSDFPTRESKTAETRRMIIAAWYEVWRTHGELQKAADIFSIFPTNLTTPDDVPKHITDEDAIEAAFWIEVDTVYNTDKAMGLTKHEAVIAVSQYMPRGEFL